MQLSKLASTGLVPLVAGVSLGLSINQIIKKNEPVVEKGPDNKTLDLLTHNMMKVNQLEFQQGSLHDSMREINSHISQLMTQHENAPKEKSNVDVFKLSQIIEANDLASANRHKRDLEEHRKALMREHLVKVEGEILKVENKYRPTINKIKELEDHLETQNQIIQRDAPSRLLWISSQSLLARIKDQGQTPLEKDPAYQVLRRFAADNNPFAIHILDSIPAKALKEGVQSEENLISRFSNVDRVCKRVAMIDERGGGAAKYLLSYLQSLLIIDDVHVSEDEVTGKKLVNPSVWKTHDILARVRYCLGKRNLEQAVRYANQLRGQARFVARDWIRDARIHLETMQAFNVLATYAEASTVDAARQTYIK